MSSKKKYVFGALIASGAGLIFCVLLVAGFESWCAGELKKGLRWTPPTDNQSLSVEDLKRLYPDGIYPDPPPPVAREKQYHLPMTLWMDIVQENIPLPDTKTTFKSYRHVLKMSDGSSVLWDIPFLYDRYGRRVVPNDEKKSNTESFLALFGDSNIVGYGIKGEDTIANQFSMLLPRSKIYNYSGVGYYPYQILQLSEKINRTEEIPEKEGVGLYFYMSYHLRRNMAGVYEIGSPWNSHRQVVDIDDKGDFILKGKFKDEMPFRFWVLNHLKETAIFKYLGIDIKPFERDYLIQTALIKKMQKNLKANGIKKFYVVIHPMQEQLKETQTLISYLHKEKIPFIYMAHWNMVELTEGPVHLKIDIHYSGNANKVLAQGLAKVFK